MRGKKMDKNAVLCYAENHWAWFTTRELNKQWGDDWNDAPYEHNAGWPYECADYNIERGDEPWEIYSVAWDGDFILPNDGTMNSMISVEQINSGHIAWLRTSKWQRKQVYIFAGTTLKDFVKMVQSVGGNVYFPADKVK
jgi:hypothetical protein